MRPSVFALCAALAVGFAFPSGAYAQLMGSQPYQPSVGRSGAGFGMSPAYREAILNQKLLGRQSNPLVRGTDGRLLDVERRGDQAFVREPERRFVLSALPSQRGDLRDGGDLSAPSRYQAIAFGSGISGGLPMGMSAVESSRDQLPWGAVSAGAALDSPVNIWIAALDAGSERY